MLVVVLTSQPIAGFMVISNNKTGASGEVFGRVEALDLLRLVAVLGVVLFHYGFRGPTAHDTTHVALPQLASFARYGFLGVPIFFVISGFVIAYSAEGRTAFGFAIARVARIYPGFVFCLTLTFLMTLAFGAPAFETSLAQWAANLFIAAPALRQPYMDSAYWSLVYEATFYAWVTVLIAAGAFRRRIDIIVLLWLCISLLNELVFESVAIRKIFLTDVSGFFATGLLIYDLYLGRRDAILQLLLASSVICAVVVNAVYNLAWLRDHTGESFDDWTVATICLASILMIMSATRIRHLPLPSNIVIAIGGMTYSFYLLHQQIGYVVFKRIEPVTFPALLVVPIVLAIAALSWATWRYVERPAQRFTKWALTILWARFTEPSRLK
jgi:peptidoglycan/LPS O-acetylase OafA/YrhL